MRILPLIPFLLLVHAASSQHKFDRGHGHATIREAMVLAEQNKGDEALDKLATIHRSDSLYERSLLTRVRLLVDQSALASAEKTCVEGIALRGEMSSAFMLMRTAILLDQERYDATVQACDSVIAELPGSFRGRHVKALALAKKGDRNAALRLAMDNARRFPFQRDAHILLGDMAQSEDKPTQAALAYMMAQLVRFDDRKAEQLLVQYDKCLGGSAEPARTGYDLSIAEDDLDDIDLLIKSKVAMDPKYKVKPDLTYPTCRQSHVLFKSIADRKGGRPGFYERFYGPMAKAIMDQGKFEPFVYHCLIASSNAQVNGVAVKNKAKVIEFRNWLIGVMQEHYQMFPEQENGPALAHVYNDSDDLLAYGPGNLKTGRNTGEWVVFSTSGRVSGRGAFNANGEREGRWTHWGRSGALESEGDYRNGKFNGLIQNYHDTGNKQDSTIMRDGKRHGPSCNYYRLGGRRVCKVAVDDAWTGPVIEHRPAGMVEWEYALKAGKTDGTAKQFHANGTPQYTGAFKDDQRTGTHVEYHANGQKAEEYSYMAGKGEGAWKNWHPNGKVSKEGTLKGGTLIGEVRSYDEWGTLRKLERYGEGGKLQGLREEFNKNGSRYMDMEYKNDLLVRYVYYGSDGKVLGQGTRTKGKFQLKGYHPDGILRVEGLYLDEGAKDGLWKYYHPDGTLDSDENYAKGTETGTHKYYDEGGFLTRQDEYYEREGSTYRSYSRYFRSGQVSERGQMKGSKVEGVLRRFFANGTQRSIEYYAEGTREGWQEYFDPDGKRVYAERYDAGAIAERVDYDEQGVEYGRAVIPAGPFELVTKFPNGKVMQRLDMLNGWLHGKARWLYPDGSTELEGGYLNGDRHGTWTHYHPNGKKRSETTYVLGSEEGEVKQYHMDGTIRFETTYRTGKREGASREYHANGKIAFLRTYENGELHGPTISYTYDAVPQMVRFYHKGDLVSYGSPAADGSVKDTIRVGLGIAKLETRFPNGTVSRTMSYRNGAIDGEFIEYHANGQLMEKTTNKAGQVEGTSMEYYPNGKTMESLPYVDGLLHGERIIYWDNGQVRERITYAHGQMHGPWTVHDRTGKRLATYRLRNDDVVEMGK